VAGTRRRRNSEIAKVGSDFPMKTGAKNLQVYAIELREGW
jgi:hypothetical protein